MLKHLIKYDALAVQKRICVFYIISFVLALLCRICTWVSGSLLVEILFQIFRGALISMVVSTLINCLSLNWVRFSRNFYGDESYLTHTLPVSRSQLFLSKTLVAMAMVVVSGIVLVACLFLALYTKAGMEGLRALVSLVAQTIDTSVTGFLFGVVLLVLLELATILMVGFVGILLGYRRLSAKVGFSYLWGGLIYFGIQIGLVALIAIISVFSPAMRTLLVTTTAPTLSIFHTLIWVAAAYYAATTLGLYFLGRHLFSRGVNVE